MNLQTLLGVAVVSVVFGGVLGYFLRHLIVLQRKSSIELKIKQLLVDTKAKAQTISEEASKKAEAIVEAAKKEERSVVSQVRKREEGISRKEEMLEKRRQEVENVVKNNKKKIEEIKKVQEKLKVVGENCQKIKQKTNFSKNWKINTKKTYF